MHKITRLHKTINEFCIMKKSTNGRYKMYKISINSGESSILFIFTKFFYYVHGFPSNIRLKKDLSVKVVDNLGEFLRSTPLI